MPEVYNLSVEEALKLHGHSDDEAGLSDSQVVELQAKYGKNDYSARQWPSTARIFDMDRAWGAVPPPRRTIAL